MSAFIADDEEPSQVIVANNNLEAVLYANSLVTRTSERNSAALAFKVGGFLIPIKMPTGRLAIYSIHHCHSPNSSGNVAWLQSMSMYGILHNARDNVFLIPQKIDKFPNNDEIGNTPKGLTLLAISSKTRFMTCMPDDEDEDPEFMKDKTCYSSLPSFLQQ